MTMKNIRKNIIKDKDILYFDFTASGLGYKPVEKKIQKILKTYANTHSEATLSAVMTSKFCIDARACLRRNLQISDDFYLFPCGTGATGAIKKFQELLGLYIPPKTKKRYKIKPHKVPLVIVGPYEHHSNELSFREALCECVRVGLDSNGNVDMRELKHILKKNKNREIIASFSVASNVTGIKSDYKTIYKLVKRYGGILALDGASSSAYMNVNCNFYDALFLSPHKLLGGPGSCGLLIMRKELCNEEIPTFAGGGTVKYVSRTSRIYFEDMEIKENAGTPGILQVIRASQAYDLRNKIGLNKIAKKEKLLKKYFLSKIKNITNITIYGNQKLDSISTISFNIKDIYAEELSSLLSKKYSIQTRAGCSCAGPYGHDLLNITDDIHFIVKPGWLRVSLHYTHTKKDIDKFVFALKKCVDILKGKK